MRLLISALLMTIITAKANAQESPLEELTVVTTRLRCTSGFANITYGYKRGTKKSGLIELDFLVIQTNKHNPRFKTCFNLSSKVDDVTPPAYLAIGDGVVDLPSKDQIHFVANGRYSRSDSDISLSEIRGWLDQPQLNVSVKSLLDYRSRSRAAERNSGG